ncbi:MAG: hypothetical protein WA755_14290 [Candidatus Acidiferrales bacterium]
MTGPQTGSRSVSQKYCPGEDNIMFSAVFTLRLKFENRTDKVLIVDKRIGKFPDVQIIAKSMESLALREYEADPIFDSFGLDHDPSHFKPNTRLLRSSFILLPPGQSFQNDTTIAAFVWYVNTPDRKGPINYGDHVLQMGFSGWSYSANASRFAEAWRTFGELVTEEIYTEPIDFQIPQRPQIEKTCN